MWVDRLSKHELGRYRALKHLHAKKLISQTTHTPKEIKHSTGKIQIGTLTNQCSVARCNPSLTRALPYDAGP